MGWDRSGERGVRKRVAEYTRDSEGDDGRDMGEEVRKVQECSGDNIGHRTASYCTSRTNEVEVN